MFRSAALFSCCVLLSSTTLGQKPDETNAAELKALVGKYKVAKVELGGMDITEHLKEMKFEIKDDGKYTAQVGELKDDATFTVDPAKKPREMDVKPTGGPQKGKLVRVIYKQEGDTLTMCYDHDKPENRQSKFESKEGTTVLLITYKREKK
jgi:uncharacterized protein (TIGR03067 family)